MLEIKSVPMTFHCKGMMQIISQMLQDNIKGQMRTQVEMLLTEYAKFYLYDKAGLEEVTAKGVQLKIEVVKQ